MLRGKVKNMLMGQIAQERAARYTALQPLRAIRELAPVGDETADIEAPVGIEVIDDPLVALHRGEVWHDVGQMGCPIYTGAGLPEMPNEMTRRHDKRGQ